MDPIKEAFAKIKEDIKFLANEVLTLKEDLTSLNSKVEDLSFSIPTNSQTIPTHNSSFEASQTDKQTHNPTIPTHNYPLEPLYPSNSNVSIGNEGVPTDRQTDSQTNQQTDNTSIEPSFMPLKFAQSSEISMSSNTSNYSNSPQNPLSETVSDFKKASEILDNLDNVKKAIRLKFKRLTPQEMLVFSTLYGLEEQNIEEITYKLLANNLNLSESSIRDYTNKLIKKGVPIEKIRQNNKTIILKISKDLKTLATLATIQRLRDL